MIEIRQAKNSLPHDMLFGPLGHTGGLLCRKHAQHFMRLPGGSGFNGWMSALAMMRSLGHRELNHDGEFRA